ncbi:hypothetical protein M407DRAFT_27041 [Tulasnella calospora MUT 4182]|uniref:Vacuolar membrane-associated protein IML1 n=1 Tax=Tulasnella calospora MUT 4182 TaxID=1051891 RepID=A0A0C3Q3X2_9AGAM|nr:hypothetical protein M407DRAFT_27041 [Tulasnella calospora MUT 4182]
MSVFCFVVGKDDGVAGKHGQQITVPKHLATVFNLQNRSEVILTKISKESVTADAVEVYFRDQYLGRCDMWRLEESLEEQCIHVEEKITFAGCVSATVKALYVKNKKVSSAYITPRTKMIFRSMSAKTTIFIQVCRELWDFADDGERYYEKICHFFLPALIERWQNASTTHVVTIVLVSRVFYEPEEKEYAAGPLRQDPDSGKWYKDFYKVIVDLEVVHDWKPSLVYLKESFWTFQRDILLTHHYHRNLQTQQNQRETAGTQSTESEEDIPVRLVGRLSMAHEGPVLEALNLNLNPMESHYVDRSLVLTGSSTILISPGTGHFRVNKRLLQLTTTRMLDQGQGLDLVCLSKAPLHRSPVFSFSGVEPGTNESIPGLRDTDPLWVWEEEDGPILGLQPMRRRDKPQVKKILFWEPFWVSLSFWDQQNNMPFREDRFVPRARMYEIQMLGLLAHDVSTLAIPHLKDNEGIQVPPVSGGGITQEEAIRTIRDQFDSDVFALKAKERTASSALVRGPPPSSTPGVVGTSHLPAKGSTSEYGPGFRSQLSSHAADQEHPKSKERPSLSSSSSTSSTATSLANFNNNPRGPKVKAMSPRLKSPLLPEKVIEEPARASPPSTPLQRSHSPSQMSVRSTSTASMKEAKKRTTRPATLASKLGVGQWIIHSLTGRAGPSQAEASQVSITGEKATRPVVATPSTAVTQATAHHTQQQEPIINIKGPSPIMATAQPIAIKNTGSLPRRSPHPLTNRTEDPIKQPANTAVGRPRSFASPVSSSPGQDSIIPAAIAARRPLEAAAAPPVNPSRPMSILSQSQSSLARRWQHIFPHPTLQYQIKWKSMCTPACLPLTTEYYPSKTELEKAYQVYSYDVLVTPDVRGSFMLKRTTNSNEEEEWPLLVMKQMAALRLALGFQFIVAPHPTLLEGLSSQPTPGNETAISVRYTITGPVGSRYAAPVHPIGASEFLKSITDNAYLSMSNQIHRISFDPIEQVIQVARYVRRTTHSLESHLYQCLVWPRLGDGYREVSATFAYPNLDMYGWNRMDMLVAGYEHDLAETLRYWRTRFVVIPSDSAPTFAQLSGEKLSDEEIRLLGAEKLAELFHRARWYKPNEKPDDVAPTRFLLTTLEPSACVLDEGLTAALDQIHEQGPLKKKPNSSKTVEDTPLATLAKAMREEDGVPMKDHIWNRNPYPDSFTGDEFVSWLVREYKDVATREQGAAWGVRLMEQGFMEHCRGAHGFLDGHYYYRLKDDYSAAQAARGPRWFRGTASPGTRQQEDALLTSAANLEAVASRAGLTPASTSVRLAGSKKSKRKLTLSQTMIIDVDPGGKSKGSETAILHHDIIHNPYTALHFELNWMGTTARFIDDTVQSWSRSIEKYGLRLVEAYVDEIVRIQDRNVFQSTFPIRLAVPPPEIPNLAARLPEGSNAGHYFEHCILRHFGYILDIEAGGRYSDAVDVCYSYRRSSFRYSQFVHKSGLAFVQVIGGKEGFRWLTNRLAGTSNSFSNSHTRNAGGVPGGAAPGGGNTGGGGRASTGGSMAPGLPIPPERPDKDRTPTSVLIQRHLKGLSEFCSDPARLQAFYRSITDMLPSDNVAPGP